MIMKMGGGGRDGTKIHTLFPHMRVESSSDFSPLTSMEPDGFQLPSGFQSSSSYLGILSSEDLGTAV